jgi:C4-dicarboxylate-specific signal transduction histidine kinase
VELCLDVHPGLPRVTLAGEQLTQVVLNLILNAADALQGRAGARVTVRACRHEGNVHIEVEDNGPGVPSEIAEHIFRLPEPGGRRRWQPEPRRRIRPWRSLRGSVARGGRGR